MGIRNDCYFHDKITVFENHSKVSPLFINIEKCEAYGGRIFASLVFVLIWPSSAIQQLNFTKTRLIL